MRKLVLVLSRIDWSDTVLVLVPNDADFHHILKVASEYLDIPGIQTGLQDQLEIEIPDNDYWNRIPDYTVFPSEQALEALA